MKPIQLLSILSLLPMALCAQCSVDQSQRRIQSNEQKVRADITAIKAALDQFAMRNGGNYPDSLALLVAPDANGQRFLNATALPRDPWNHEYVYARGKTVNVISYGANGVPGGAGEDADIDCVSIMNAH